MITQNEQDGAKQGLSFCFFLFLIALTNGAPG